MLGDRILYAGAWRLMFVGHQYGSCFVVTLMEHRINKVDDQLDATITIY